MGSSAAPSERSAPGGPAVAVDARAQPSRRGHGRRPFLTGDASPPRPEEGQRRIRIVVVDDNEGFRESLVALLAAAGHEVAGEAGDGREALDLVERTGPDVVLMDIRMPSMDGIETTR